MHPQNSLDNFIITKSRNLSLLALAFALALTTQSARAATDTWSGAGADVNWQTAGNWSDGANAAPSAFDSLDFTGSLGLTNTNNFATNTAFDGITFDNNNSPGAFTLNGSGVLLSGQISTPADLATNGIINNSTNAETINLSVTLDWGTYLFNNTNATPGTIALNGGLTSGSSSTALFGTGITSTSLTLDPNTGLISNLNGAGLILNSATTSGLALLPLATISGGNIVALGSSSYTSVLTGLISSNADSNVLLTANPSSSAATAYSIGAANTYTFVNTITALQNTGTDTLQVSGTLVFGAGAANSVGGLYVTGATGHQTMTFNASSGVNAITAGTTSAGGTIVLADSVVANTANQIENNEKIVNNAAGGPVTVIKTGPGSMYFNSTSLGPNSSTFTGGLYVDQGWLQGNGTGDFGLGPIYVAGGATLYVETNQSNNYFISPGVGDASNEGALKFNNNSSVQSGTLTLQGSAVTSAPGDRITANLVAGTVTFTNQITGAGTLDMDTQASNTATAFVLNNTTANHNNWTGGTIIENNNNTNRLLVQDGASNQFGQTGGSSAGNMTFTQAGGGTGSLTFDLHGFSDTIGALITNGGSVAGTFVNNSTGTATLTIGDNGGSGAFGGTIEGTNLNIIKTGLGVQTLSGNNSYTGTTTINNGALVVTGTIAPAGTVTLDNTTVSGNPTLAGGNSTVAGVVGNVTLPVNNGSDIASISPGTTGTLGSIGELTMTSLTMNGGQLLIDLSSPTTAGTTYDWINVLGNLTLPTSSAAWSLAPSTGASAGVYTVLTAAGTTNIGSGAALPTMNSPSNPLVRPTTYTPSFLGTTALQITVSGGSASVIWTGTNGSGGNGIWDVATTQNWNDSSAPSPTGQFFQGDSVTLNDTGTNSNITVVSGTVSGNAYTSVQPSSLTVSSNSVNYTIGGQPIISPGALAKSGASTLTLNGSNSFGSIGINGGIVNVGNAGALGSTGNITFGGGTLQYSASNQTDYSGRIASSGSAITIDTNGQNVTYASVIGTTNTGGLIKNGLGNLTLTNNNTFTGNTVINSGTLTLTDGNNTAGALAGSPTITINAGGALVLTNNNTFGFTVGEEAIVINDGLIDNSNAADHDPFHNSVVMTGGTIAATGTGGSGGGGGAFSWNNGGTGPLLTVTSDAGGAPALISAQTTLQTSGTFIVNRGSAVSGNSPDVVFSGLISQYTTPQTAFAISGANNGGITVFAAPNTFTAATTIYNGIVNYQNGTAFGTNSAIAIASGSAATVQVQGNIAGGGQTLTIGGAGDTGLGATGALENVSGVNSDAGSVSLTANTTISSDSGTLTLSGLIVDGGVGYNLTKSGTGTLTLSGPSSYLGATLVTAGTLNLTGSLNGTSSVTVTNATLEGTGLVAAGITTIGNGTDAAGTAVIEPGAVGVVGTLTSGNSVSLLSDGKFVFNLDSTGGGAGNGSSELVASAVSLDAASEFTFNDISGSPGALTMGDVFTAISTTGGLTGTFSNLSNGEIFAASGNVYQVSYTPDALTLTVVPEPATWGMMIAGMGMLVGIQRLRRRQTRG